MSEDYCTYEDIMSNLKGMDLSAWTEEEVIRLIDMFANQVDDVMGTAFREVRVENEMHTARIPPYRDMFGRSMAVHLQFYPVKSIISLRVYEGKDYVEWIGTKTEGRDKDYWVDYANGIIYLTALPYWSYGLDVKVSYVYGNGRVPARVWELNVQYVVRYILTQMAHVVAVPEGGQNPIDARLSRVETRIEDLEHDLVGWNIVDEGIFE